MHPSLKISAAILVNLSLLCHQVFAQLPPISFETYDSVPVDLFSPEPWEPVYGNASVTPAGQGFGGGKALKIGVDPQEEAWLRKPVTWNPAETVAFINFRNKPAATPACSQANSMLFSLAAKTRLIMWLCLMKHATSTFATFVATVALFITSGCTVKVDHKALTKPAMTQSGTVSVSQKASGVSERVGWGTLTVFAIPVAPAHFEADAGEKVMKGVSDALAISGYSPSITGAVGGKKRVVCNVKESSFRNYTYFFPIVFTWGRLTLDVSVVNSKGATVWNRSAKGGSFNLYPLGGFEAAGRSSITKALNTLATDFSSPEFSAAVR